MIITVAGISEEQSQSPELLHKIESLEYRITGLQLRAESFEDIIVLNALFKAIRQLEKNPEEIEELQQKLNALKSQEIVRTPEPSDN